MLSSEERPHVEEGNTSLDRRRGNLADLLDGISREEDVYVILERGGGRYRCGGPSNDKKFTGDRGSYKEILGSIATSTVLKVLELHDYSEEWKYLMEEISEALRSNRSVKKFTLWSLSDEVLEMMSEVLLKNECLEDVSLYRLKMDKEGAASLSNALHRNRTLKRLHLRTPGDTLDEEGWKKLLEPLSGGDGCNHVLEHFGFTCHTSESNNCNVHIGNMVRNNTSLHSLRMGLLCKDLKAGTNVVCSIGEALRFNTRLSRLKVNLWDGFHEGRDVLKGLLTSLTPDARGQQPNTTLKHLDLFCAKDFNLEYDPLFNMLRSNTSLIELVWWGFFRKAEDVIQLLESLKSNKCLEILDLTRCEGVEGRRVLGAIMDLFLENYHLKEIKLAATALARDGSAQIIEAELEKRKKYRLWKVVEGMATTTPTSARVFLCGEPYAGKTTLQKTIMEIRSISMKEKTTKEKMKAWCTKPFKGGDKTKSVESKHEERTRGIEVHNLSYDDIDMTIWDMAGQEEYHAFHDLVVPNLSGVGSCSSFILVCDPQFEYRTRQRKNEEDVKKELQYWLRFIASNTRISDSYKPHVTIVFTHFDKWSLDVLFHQRITEEVDHLKQQFEGLLEFEENIFRTNAMSTNSVDGTFRAVVDHLKGLLRRVPKTIEACAQLQHVVAKWILKNPNKLLVDWGAFSQICCEVEDLDVSDSSNPGLADMRKKLAALSLHDTGHLIYYEDLNIIVMNPHLFCHDVMGELIAKCINEKSNSKLICNGCIRKGDLQILLSNFPTAKKHQVSLQDVVQIMLKLKLCYEQSDEAIIIPATLPYQEKLTWPCETKVAVDYKYVGRRLACEDTARTLLSPGFFLRLQVSFQEQFKNGYKIMKNLITFIHNGMDVIIEYSDSNGFHVDIMIRSNENLDIILHFFHTDIKKNILELCANPTLGCPGVNLVEYIMRPSCVEGLNSCKSRRNQVVLVKNLKQAVLACGNLALKYTWPDKETLKSDYDDAITLLGKKVSDALFNQLVVDLNKIEDQIVKNHAERTDTNHSESSLIEAKCTKPLNVTNEDIFNKIGRLEVGMHRRFDTLEGKIDEIKLIQDKLWPKIYTGLEALVTFTLEFEQHKYPRLAFLTIGEKLGLKRFIVTHMVPGMTSFVVRLLCERKDGFHIVDDQEGCEVSFGTELTEKFLTLVKWSLRVFTVLVKVGAHIGAGMGSMIPDLGKGFLLLTDTPGILDGVDSLTNLTILNKNDPFISRHDVEVAQQWLVDILKAKCKSTGVIKKMFQLQKVKYKENGSVAWICTNCVSQNRNSIDLLHSEIH